MVVISRRTFLGTAVAASSLTAQAPSWPSRVLDIHLHPRREGAAELDHLQGAGVDRAVLLAGANAEDRARSLVAEHPERFARFAGGEVSSPEAVARFRKSLETGAIGLGELKNPVQIDGAEMRRIYDLAAERRVPVLLHFEEGNFNSGIRRLPEFLKAHPRTIFIGHGQTWWAHISADPGNETSYPAGAIKPGGLTDKVLADYPNMYGDLSANSGRNAITRDQEFAASFLKRHRQKLMFGSDCPCTDGRGGGQTQGAMKGKCIARETLTAMQKLTTADLFRTIAWDNGTKLLKIST